MDSNQVTQQQLHKQWVSQPQTQELIQTIQNQFDACLNTAIGQSVTGQDIETIRIFLNRAHELRNIRQIILNGPATEPKEDETN
jgi:hypothetical protein